MEKFIFYFDEIDKSSLPFVGGKGANLGEMTKAGFPVPGGFCVSTSAYQSFIAKSAVMSHFFARLDKINPENLDEIRVVGKEIRTHLENVPIPADIRASILQAWEKVGSGKAYAVRSSATAEDLPTASFAGQQDTYLNVIGSEQLIHSIQKCWASLFTDRAISYRAKNRFDHRQVFLSVVVQEMIFPDVSGIMFTADPISGNRNITSIDASFGLGEALVSGLVSADLYQVRQERIIQKKISKKKIAIYSIPEGGTVTKELSDEKQQAEALSDAQIIELAKLGQKIEAHYGTEQDIEWCLSDGNFYIVQSRPITSLFPVPHIQDSRLHALVSVGHIQMMTEAMKPFGLSMFKIAIPISYEAGGRIYGDLTSLLCFKPLRKRIPKVLLNMDERMGSAILEFLDRSDVELPSKRIPFRKIAPIARIVGKTIAKNLFIADPEKSRTLVNNLMEQSVQNSKDNVLAPSGAARIMGIEQDLKNLFLRDLPSVVPFWVTGVIASNLIHKLAQKWQCNTKDLEILNRSLPGNVTSELGLMIGDLADIVREHPQLAEHLQTRMDENFYDGLDTLPGGRQFHKQMEEFMNRYGMRCPGEIDISRPRWREAPTTLVPAIMSHMRTVRRGEHRVKFEQGTREAEKAALELIADVRNRKGRIQARILSRLIKVYRGLGGLREHHKYLVIQHFDIFRQAILEEARSLVKKGALEHETDVFYLSINEIYALANGTFTENARHLVVNRKKQFEYNQKLVPPRFMTSEGEVMTGRRRQVNAPEGALIGTPVSSGVVEGYAKVVLHPEEAKLNPGEIMIAPFTDPGWTPLFHSAKALVMEVGGMMTHGAVVAREYGIPAVVGIDNATEILKDGTYIRIDGSEGYVQILH